MFMLNKLSRSLVSFYLFLNITFLGLFSFGLYAEIPSGIADLVISSISDQRKAEIQIALENSSKFLLYATGKSDNDKIELFTQAQKYLLMKLEDIFHNYKVEKTGNNVEKLIPITHVPSWTLKDEVEYMIKEADHYQNIVTPEMIDRFDKVFASLDVSKISNVELFDPGISPKMIEFVSHIQQHVQNPEHRNSKSVALSIVDTFETEIEKHINRIKHLGDEIVSKVESDKIDKLDPRIMEFVTYFINDYYQSLDEAHLKNIISDFITLGPNATDEQMIEVMINNSGPTLGKSFQQLAKEEELGEEFTDLIKVLESDGKQVPFHLIDKKIKADKGGYEFISVDPKPLGTGTVAQVHKARIKYKGKEIDVAVRIIKPGTEELANTEIKFVESFIEKRIKNNPAFQDDTLPDFERNLRKVRNFVLADTDIMLAIERQSLGQAVYQKTRKIKFGKGKEKTTWLVDTRVPDLYPPLNGQDTDLQVMELIKYGKKFSKLDNADAQKAVSRSMFSMWFEESLFRSGFTHFDLHQGNFTVLVEDNNKVKLYLLDYGMSVDIPPKVQRTFILFAIGAGLKDAKFIHKAINLSNKAENNKLHLSDDELLKLIKSKIKKGWNTENWIIWAVKNKLLVNDEIDALARGGMLVSQLPRLIGDETFPKKSLIKMALKNLWRSIWDRSYSFPIKGIERLQALKSSCIRTIRSLF